MLIVKNARVITKCYNIINFNGNPDYKSCILVMGDSDSGIDGIDSMKESESVESILARIDS